MVNEILNITINSTCITAGILMFAYQTNAIY